MKKKGLLLLAAVVFAGVALQQSMAYFRERTNVSHTISATTLGIDLVEHSNDEHANKTTDGYAFRALMPGVEVEHESFVENTEGKALYLRVTLTKYWKDENGEKNFELDPSMIQINTKDTSDWIIQKDENSNDEVMYFYYRKPLQPKERTSNITDSFKVDEKASRSLLAKKGIEIDIEAEAIQAIEGAEAILSEWGMNVTLDENGVITAVEE